MTEGVSYFIVLSSCILEAPLLRRLWDRVVPVLGMQKNRSFHLIRQGDFNNEC